MVSPNKEVIALHPYFGIEQNNYSYINANEWSFLTELCCTYYYHSSLVLVDFIAWIPTLPNF